MCARKSNHIPYKSGIKCTLNDFLMDALIAPVNQTILDIRY